MHYCIAIMRSTKCLVAPEYLAASSIVGEMPVVSMSTSVVKWDVARMQRVYVEESMKSKDYGQAEGCHRVKEGEPREPPAYSPVRDIQSLHFTVTDKPGDVIQYQIEDGQSRGYRICSAVNVALRTIVTNSTALINVLVVSYQPGIT